jgi:hypothetical protein
MRALLVGMEKWVRQGSAPPPSRYPRLQDGTLVRATDLAFPDNSRRGLASQERCRARAASTAWSRRTAEQARRCRCWCRRSTRTATSSVGSACQTVMVPLADDRQVGTFEDRRSGGHTCSSAPGLVHPLCQLRRPNASGRTDPRLSIEERYQSRDRYSSRCRTPLLTREGTVTCSRCRLSRQSSKTAGDHWDLLVKEASSTSTRAER